jgi:hypothetical protein
VCKQRLLDAGIGPDLTPTHVLLSAHKAKSWATGYLIRKHEFHRTAITGAGTCTRFGEGGMAALLDGFF